MSTAPTDYDSPWKEMLEHFFPHFLLFFFPDIHADVDWTRDVEFLESELQQITRGAATGKRRVDKLVRVFLKTGEEQWVLVHVEVQGQRDDEFAERVYIYNYRIFDIFRRPVASLAVLTDDHPGWRPDSFSYSQWGVRAGLDFRSIKVLDWGEHWADLEQDPSPFAIVVMAHLKTLETRRAPADRKAWKWSLTRMLYERGYGREQIINLFRFIDWVMMLPLGLEQELRREIEAFEETQRMKYVSTIERLAERRGIEQGIEQGREQALREAILDVLAERFGLVPDRFSDLLNQIEEIAVLQTLLRQAVTIASLELFEERIARLSQERED
jgi:hypothetical protein